MSQAKHEFTKIFVSCQQQSPFSVCQSKHCVVGNSRCHFRHVQHIVTVSSETINNLPIYILVGQ